jgi:rhodanese-related sulfurtransferase
MKILFTTCLAAGWLLGSTIFVAASAAEKKTTPPAVRSENVSVETAAKLLRERKDIVVLDVRTPDEFKEGHIPGAQNLDFRASDFKQKLGQLDKSKTYLIHCQAGGRSGQTQKLMQELQFKSVLHLNDGFSEWEEKGQPVEK